MKTSAQGRQLITEREGCVLKPYFDTIAKPPVWTDGVGNTHGVVPNGPPITQEKADEDLARNLAWVEGAINSKVQVPLEQYEFDALASFIFNVGAGAFESSTLLRLINLGDPDAAAQFPRWNIPPEIVSRRLAEMAQFKGDAFVARLETAIA